MREGLFVGKDERESWPDSVVFIEPPPETSRLTALYVCLVQGEMPLMGAPGIEGGVVAVIPIASGRSLQLVAVYEPSSSLRESILQAFEGSVRCHSTRGAFPELGSILLHGRKPDGTHWITVAAFRRTEQTEGSLEVGLLD